MKINEGYTRKVLIFNKFVVKFPKINFDGVYYKYNTFGIFYGFKCNIAEKKIYKRVSNKEKLAKLYFSAPFGLFNIMERVDTIRNLKQKHAELYFNKIFKEVLPNCDYFVKNFGFRGRKIVLLDYGEVELINEC